MGWPSDFYPSLPFRFLCSFYMLPICASMSSLTLFPEVLSKLPICQNSTPPSRLDSNATSTVKASQALLVRISCFFLGVSSVVPVTALGR